MLEKGSFKVIIAGGGIAGLTLANSLTHAHIDYILLEAHDEIAPQVGATIGILAQGGRILDQLGMYDDIFKLIEPIEYINQWHEGKVVDRNDAPQLFAARHGYPLAFLDRQLLLEILYTHLPDKSKVLLGKRISKVDHSTEGIIAHCQDGTSYHGDIIAAADGVHSIVRQEMWHHADQSISTKEKNGMIAEYKCLFGISTRVEGLTPGETELVYGKDYSFLVICGKDGRTFWFEFIKMEKIYRTPEIPRFTKQDAEDQMKAHSHLPITNAVTFGDILKTRATYTLTPLEEAFYKTWTWGRFVTLGDSTHKMTPNIAQGGNAAIESAAALSNSLKRLLSNATYEQPSFEEVTHSLRSFQKIREVRAKGTCEISNKMTRVEALKGLPERMLALYISPYTGDWLGNLAAHGGVGAEKLEYLPDTERSFKATMPFNRNYGVGHEESRLYRAMIALPILGMGYLCHIAMGSVISQDRVLSQLSSALANGNLDFGSAKTYTLLPTYYGGLTWLDNIWRIPIIAFSPSVLNIDPIQRLQMISFLVDAAPLYLIWVLESHRRANVMTFARFPVLFGIAFQLFGIGSIGPLYYFLHYIQSPLSQFLAADMRLINVGYARTALIAIAIAYLAPTIAMYFLPSASTRLSINAIWQMFPILVMLTHWAFARLLVNDPTRSARLRNPTADLLSVRIATMTFIVVSALTFNWIRFTSPVPLSTVLSPTFPFLSASYRSIMNRSLDLDLVSGMTILLKMDYLSCFIASYAWLALLFNDLKDAEMVTETWARLAAYAIVGTFFAGPGAVVGGAWLWREEILASKRAAGAVVRGRSTESTRDGNGTKPITSDEGPA